MNAPLALVVAWTMALGMDHAHAQDWQPLDPEQVLVIDSSQGRMLVEMRPDMAQLAVARIKKLSREGVYNGLQFHRVIAGFVAQTGNPNNKDGGTSQYADLAPEFVFKLRPGPATVLAGRSSDASRGFLGSVPFEGTPIDAQEPSADQTIRAWGAYCAGVAGMGRQNDKGTANSELFFMLAPARRLDRDYTVWGRVIVGFDVLQKLVIGEPPAKPDTMRQVRVLADLPPAQRPRLAIASGNKLDSAIQKARADKGADFSVCDVNVPVQYLP